MKIINILPMLVASAGLWLMAESVYAAPPALITASFGSQAITFTECQIKAIEIMEKLHLEIDDHGNGTVIGFGDQSVASVTCHNLEQRVFIQIAVASQKEEAADVIIRYIRGFLKDKSGDIPANSPAGQSRKKD